MPNSNPIDHLIILMMENRSFDHYFGALSVDDLYPFKDKIEGFKPGTRLNCPDLKGNSIPIWKASATDPSGNFIANPDPPHDPGAQVANFNGGEMDGFVKNYEQMLLNDPNTKGQAAQILNVPMSFFDRDALPVFYSLADNFTVCDHWFSSMLSSTWPNRKYLHSGLRDSDTDTQLIPGWRGFQTTPFLDVLEDHRDEHGNLLTWQSYFTDLPFLAFWYKFAAFHAIGNFSTIEQFVHDCRENNLPSVTILDPAFSLADDHPTHDVRLGQKFIGLIVDALTNSESWSNSALVITYDENGGFFDHVPPPVPPESHPMDTPLGFRVPTLVISPYARNGVSSVVHDHTSIIKSVATRWGIDFDTSVFGERYKDMPDIWESCFDFTMAPRPPGIYTESPTTANPYKNLNWQTGIQELMTSPIGDLEALLERMFLLPGIKRLDQRKSVYSTLDALESTVIDLKRLGKI